MKWIDQSDRTRYFSGLLEHLKWIADWWGLSSAEEMKRDLWLCNYERDGQGRYR